MPALDDHLRELQERGADRVAAEVVLWPRTPLEDEQLQHVIAGRVGASDLQVDDPRSRAHRVAAIVGALRDTGAVATPFSVLDIACGDALIVQHVRRTLPEAACHAVDLHVDGFAAHATAREAGVRLWRVLLQDLFAAPAPAPARVDVAVMLNTYRGWDHADLRGNELGLPELADAWFDASARWTLLTMRDAQVPAWRRRGYRALDVGPGEDDSRLVLLTRERVSLRLRLRVAAIRRRATRAQRGG